MSWIQASVPAALPAGACLFALAAAWIDCREHRIPNRLVLAGLAVGLAAQATLGGWRGIASALGGLALGMAVLLPFYAIRAMGAGDVKLMGMVGAFLGAADTLQAVVLALLAGGVLAIVVALRQRTLGRALSNAKAMLAGSLLGAAALGRAEVPPPVASAGKLPYGVAIAAGTLLHVGLSSMGVAIF